MCIKGFSLVELSIVLVIIALLLGGILVGQQMIKSANLQKTISLVEEYRSAVVKFRDRFLELPGDFKSASTNWSTVTNGDGNGRIGGSASVNNDCIATNWQEQWNVWVHLGKAELIPDEFSNPGNVDTLTLGNNVPPSPIKTGGYAIRYCGDITGSVTYFDNNYGHVMQVGSIFWASGGPRGPLFTPKEAADIDIKFDDGFPHSGKITSSKKSDTISPNCTNSDVNAPTSADYNLIDLIQRCPLFFTMGF